MLGFTALGDFAVGAHSYRPPAYVPVVTDRFATSGWTAPSDDVSPGQSILGCLQPMTINRAVPLGSDQILGGVSRRSAGILQLDNTEGQFDWLAESRSYIGRPVRLKVASARMGKNPRTQDMAIVWSGLVDDVRFFPTTVQILTRDILSALERPVSSGTYGGTGGLDGIPALKGKSKPFGFGQCFNCRPELVDPVTLLYQFHDGFARRVTACRDKGAPLAFAGDYASVRLLLTAQIEPGSYATCADGGWLRLGDYPNGDVTLDFEGDGIDPARLVRTWDDGRLWDNGTGWDVPKARPYSATAAGIIRRLLVDRARLPEGIIADGHFLDVDRAWPYPMGVFCAAGESLSIIDLCGRIATAAGFVLSENRSGHVYIKRLRIPTSGLRLGVDDIIAIDRPDLPFGRPIFHAAVPFGVNSTLQAAADLVRPDDDFVPAEALKPFMAPYRGVMEAGSSRTLERVQHARSVTLEDSPYATEAGALARARDIIAMHQAERAVFRVDVKRRGWRLDLGDPVTLIHPRFGLKAGRPTVVIGIQDGGTARRVSLDLLG